MDKQQFQTQNYDDSHPVMVNNRAAAILNDEGNTCCVKEVITMLTGSLRALRELMTQGVRDTDAAMMEDVSYTSLPASLDDCIAAQVFNTTITSSGKDLHDYGIQLRDDDGTNGELSTVKLALVVPDCMVQQMTHRRQENSALSTLYCFSSVVVLYNLALAHHLYALSLTRRRGAGIGSKGEGSTTEEIQRYFSKASQLYEHSYNLCDGEGMLDCSSMLFSLILVNNMGSTFRSLNEQYKATQCFQRNLSMTMFIVDSGALTAGGSTRIPEAVLRNAMQLVFQQANYFYSFDHSCS